MGSFSRVKTPTKRGFRYTPRKRRSAIGQIFEGLIVAVVILFWIVVWACIVALPWVLLALILHLIGVI